MTSAQQILTKALDRAMENGWLYHGTLPISWYNVTRSGEFIKIGHDDSIHPELSVNDLIFDQDFAQALWGDDEFRGCRTCEETHHEQNDNNDNMRPDHYHLQEMVIAEDPLQYLASVI